MQGSAKSGGGRYSEVIPSLTGNTVWSLVKLGSLEYLRVQLGIDLITTYQRFDHPVTYSLEVWPYDKY